MTTTITVGVLALQGAVHEHIQHLHQASAHLRQHDSGRNPITWAFPEVRTAAQLDACDGLIIPGGESTTLSLVASRSGLLEALRDFVKIHRKPTWGTCAGLILLAESANRTKKGGQELIGGLDVRVNRNHFGRQTESFEMPLELPFLAREGRSERPEKFPGVFIRAPVVERLLPSVEGEQVEEGARDDTVVAPARDWAVKKRTVKPVEIMGRLPGRRNSLIGEGIGVKVDQEVGDPIAVMQDNVFGTSFHPELTQDTRIHIWWLELVQKSIGCKN